MIYKTAFILRTEKNNTTTTVSKRDYRGKYLQVIKNSLFSEKINKIFQKSNYPADK